MQRILFTCGAVAGLTGVAIASATAHALDGLAPANLAMIRAALQMHLFHAAALLGCALWLPRGGWLTAWAGLCFVAGLVVFCGAVYGLGLGWWHIPAAAPIGGTTLMLGWVLLAAGALRK